MDAWWTTLWDHGYWPAQWVAVLCIAVVAAVTDCRTRRIPNLLTLPAFVGGLCWAVMVGGLTGLADSLLAAAVVMAPFVLMFVFAGGGAGDAKLMAAIGAWLGIIGGLLTLVMVMIAGGLLSFIIMIYRRNGRDVAANFQWILDSLRTAVFKRGRARGDYVLPSVEVLHTMPYGLAILFGTCIASGGVWLWH